MLNYRIYKPPFMFLESISACQKSSWFINSYLRYNWFRNSAIWLVKSLFDLTKLKNFKSTFLFLQFQHARNHADWPCYSWDIANLKVTSATKLFFVIRYNHGHNIYENFWCFTKFSFHHKWNEAWLLVINWYIRVASRVAERLNT